jgi:putative isomerase
MTAAGPDTWNTWDADWPACAVHLGSGAVLRVGAYSASANTFTDFPWSPAYRLGAHDIDGGEIVVDLTHAGSTIRLELAAAGEGCVTGRITCLDMAEWGLRFWLLLEFGSDDPDDPAAVRLITPPGREYLQPPVALLDRGGDGPSAAFSTLDRPTDARLTMERNVLGSLMESQSYYARPPSPEQGRYAVFRISATEPVTEFAAAAGPDAAAAQERLTSVVTSGRTRAVSPSGSAIRDVLGWNTIWDPVGRQVYTVATRAWIARKFGGFGVWQIDGFLHSILAAHIGAGQLAWDNVAAVLAGRTPRGNLTALRAATTDWQDRSHPPVGAHACWSVQAMTPDDGAAARAAEVLAGALDWWFATRDGNGNGLLEYGSSPVGDGHFVHTRQGALDESANDNSPVHDDARFDESTHTLDLEDVGLNSLLVHEGGLLARMLPGNERLAERAAALAELVRTRLWDPGREVFAGRLWSGQFTRSLSPTSFYPLLAGIATPGQAEAMTMRWLDNPREFGGPYPVAGTPHSDPAALDNVYWRGRVWPCFNYLVYLGLRRYRFDDQAAWLASRGLEMFDRGWAERRCYENFSQQTGDGGDSVDAEPFYTWGSLLPMIADLEVFGTDPWDGTCFGCAGDDTRSAVGYVAGVAYLADLGPGSTALSRNGMPLLRADVRGRFRHLSVDDAHLRLSVEKPQASVENARLSVELPPSAADFTVELALAAAGGGAGSGADGGAGGVVVTLDGTPAPESRIGPIRRDGDGRDWLPVRIPASPRPRVLAIAGTPVG